MSLKGIVEEAFAVVRAEPDGSEQINFASVRTFYAQAQSADREQARNRGWHEAHPVTRVAKVHLIEDGVESAPAAAARERSPGRAVCAECRFWQASPGDDEGTCLFLSLRSTVIGPAADYAVGDDVKVTTPALFACASFSRGREA